MTEVVSMKKNGRKSDVKNGNAQTKEDFETAKQMTMDLAWENLKMAVVQAQKYFNVYKVETYFAPDLVFNAHLNTQMTIMEGAMEKMAQLVANTPNHNRKKKSSVAKVSDPITSFTIPSPTPPSSEVDPTEKPAVLDISCSRKRKSEDVLESDAKRERRASRQVEEKEEPKEEEFEVDVVKDYVKRNGKEYYHVSWKGYDSDDDTFEPIEHLLDCDDLLRKFLIMRIKQRQKKKTADDLKNLQIPLHDSVKELLYSAYSEIYSAKTNKSIKKAVSLLSQHKYTKSKDELMTLIIRFTSMKEPASEKYNRLSEFLSEQFTMKAIETDREKQQAELRAWERRINVICSDPAPITVENNVDLTLPPLNFTYINDYVAGNGIEIPDNPMVGCKCEDCYTCQKSCCPHRMESFFAYNKQKRLKVSLGTPIYECNRLCGCSPDCPNRVVQKGRRIPLTIFRTQNGRGWGVKASEFIKKDSFVTEYVGEVITSDEAEQRGERYDSQGCTYLFDLDFNKGDLNPYTVDAAKCGNVSHFINHSCDPNLVVFNVWVNCLDPDLPKLALFAARDIRKGEELSFDYNSGLTRQEFASAWAEEEGEDKPKSPSKAHPSPGKEPTNSQDVPVNPGGTRGKTRLNGTTACLCGAANCRKFFF